MNGAWPMVPLGEVLTHRKEFIQVDDLATYKRCRVQLHAQGVVLRDQVIGAEIKTKSQQVCRAGEFLVAEIDAKLGGYGLVPDDLDDVFVVRGNGSKDLVGRAGCVEKAAPGTIFPDLFIQIQLPKERMLPRFFAAVWNSQPMRDVVEDRAKTTSGIWKINQGHIASMGVPVPPLAEQRRIVAYLDSVSAKAEALTQLQSATAAELDALLPSILDKAFKGEL